MQDDDVAAEEEKVLSGSTDANDVVIIKNLMKVRQISTLGLCILKFLDIVTKLIVGLQKLHQLSD